MKLTTERLGLDHRKGIEDILRNQQTYFGMPIKEFPINIADATAFAGTSNQYLVNRDEFNRSYGAFDESGQLVGCINVDFDLLQPFWIVRRLIVREELKGTPGSTQIGHVLMDIATKEAESFGYHMHYNLIPAKYARAHLRLWQNTPARKGRYSVVTMEEVPANGVPKFRMFWLSLYGRYTYPIDTVVRLSILTKGREHIASNEDPVDHGIG